MVSTCWSRQTAVTEQLSPDEPSRAGPLIPALALAEVVCTGSRRRRMERSGGGGGGAAASAAKLLLLGC